MAAKFFALAFVALLAGQANAQLSANVGSTNPLSSIVRFGKNSLSRIAATSADNLGSMGRIANTGVSGGKDLFNAAIGVAGGIGSTINQLGFNAAGNLANVGREVANMKGKIVETGIRIPVDAVKTGMDIAAQGVDFAKSTAEKAINFGANLSTNALNATSVAATRLGDAVSNLAAGQVNLAQRAINATANAATSVNTAVDGMINSASDNLQGLASNVAGGISSGIDSVVNAGVNGLNSLATNLAADAGNVAVTADAGNAAGAAVDADASLNLSVTV